MAIRRLICSFICATLLGYSLAYAESSDKEAEIYHYQQGWQAAERITREAELSETQIKAALEGFEARLREQTPAYSQDEIRQAVEHQREMQSIAREELGQKNLEAGERFMAALESDPAYGFLNRGLAFKINADGGGIIPVASSQVMVRYVAKHLDGTLVDQKIDPTWVPLQNVLPGWRMALLNMPTGSHWTLVIPPHLAYGEHGAGNRIGPHETLIYEIYLDNTR